MLRFLWPLLLMFGPQLAPRVIKFVRAVWLLHKDHRVNVLLKLLVPLALVYAVLPVDLIRDRIPYGLGRYDDIIILGLALFIFWKLCPPAVVRNTWGNHRRLVRRTVTRAAWWMVKPDPRTTGKIKETGKTNEAVDV